MASSRLLLVVLIIIFTAAAGAGVYVWWRMHGGSLTVSSQKQEASAPAASLQPVRYDEPLSLTVYFSGDGMLVSGSVSVKRQPDAQTQAREALAAALADPRALQSGVFTQVKLREFFLDPSSGTAYVDLSPLQAVGVKAAASEELLALYAVVDTLMQNFEEIRQVRFLVDGKEAQTLAGHVDLSRKFTKRMDLVKQ